jgi:hypothetical protein
VNRLARLGWILSLNSIMSVAPELNGFWIVSGLMLWNRRVCLQLCAAWKHQGFSS